MYVPREEKHTCMKLQHLWVAEEAIQVNVGTENSLESFLGLRCEIKCPVK